MKRRIPAILAGLLLTIQACSGAPSPTGSQPSVATTAPGSSTSIAPGNLETTAFYPVGEPESENQAEVSRQLEAKFPGSEVTQTFGGGWPTPLIVQRFLAGDPPDIALGGQLSPNVFTGNAGPGGLQYANGGQLYDLTSALQGPAPDGYGDGKWIDHLHPALLPYLTNPDDGKIYALPSDVIYAHVWYNKAIFDEAELSPPQTWTQFLEACAKLKSDGIVPIALSNDKGYQSFWWDYLLLRSVDSDAFLDALLRGEGELKSIPGVADAASRVDQLLTGGYFLPGFEGTDFTAAQINFFQGKAAMILVGSWLVGEMKDSIPPDFQLASFPFPSVEGGLGDQKAMFLNTNNYVISSASERPDLAVEWLKIAGSKDNQNTRVNDLGYFQGYRGTDQPPGSEALADLLQNPGSLRAMYWGLLALPAQLQDLYRNNVQRFIQGQLTADQFVTQLSDELAQYWTNNPAP